jgi:hypothetical protein
MQLAAFTIGDLGKASSRVRSFYLFRHAPSSNIEVLRNISYQEACSCQIIHLQKIMDFQIFFWLVVWRSNRINIIYDLDDQPGSFKAKLGFMLAIFLSNTLTVDTCSRKQYWKKIFPRKNVVIIPDIADKKENTKNISPRINTDPSINFFWIGHHENISSIQDFFPFLDIFQSRLLICTDINQLDSSIFKSFPIDFIQWQRDITFSSQKMNSFMLLSHNYDEASQMKSNNKMVLAIYSGFIPIVSRTPQYEFLAKELNLEFLIFDDFSEVFSIANEAQSRDWSTIFDSSQKKLDKIYSRKSVLKKFLDECL